MANPTNFGVLTGRASRDPQVFTNADGSKTALVTMAVEDNFVSGSDRKAKTHYIPVRVFVPKNVEGLGSWGRIHEGDQFSVSTRVSCESYIDKKTNERVYPPATIEADGYPQFLESKQVTEERAARKALAAQAETPAAAPVQETAEQELARLRAELADREATAPFAGVAA